MEDYIPEQESQDDLPLFYWLILFAALLVYCIFLSFLQRMLNKIKESDREINPWSVWLMLVPLVNLVWQFVLVNGIAQSLRSEFDKRHTPLREEKPGFDIGLLMCLFNCGAIFTYYSPAFSIIPCVFWLAYWIKMAYFNKLLLRPRPVKYNPSSSGQDSTADLELFRDRLE